jgi:hypothetical protein
MFLCNVGMHSPHTTSPATLDCSRMARLEVVCLTYTAAGEVAAPARLLAERVNFVFVRLRYRRQGHSVLSEQAVRRTTEASRFDSWQGFTEASRPAVGGLLAFCSMGNSSSFPGSKSGRETDHLPPSSAEFKNEWSCTSLTRLHNMVSQ